jgi:hypothetical protein
MISRTNGSTYPKPSSSSARHRATRLAQAALVFAVALVGAVSCSVDSRVTGPLKSVHLPGKLHYDSVAPVDLKNAARLRSISGGSAARLTVRDLASSASLSAEDPSGIVVTQIPFAPEPGPFLKVMPSCDDCLLGETDKDGFAVLGPDGRPIGIPIGFDFTFYGKTYDRFYYSSNGFITFDLIYNGCCEGGSLPWPGNEPGQNEPVNNIIAYAWTDLAPADYQVTYDTRGAPGRRKLILNLENVALSSEPDVRVTTQVVLHEGSNAIEIHTLSKGRNMWQMTTQGIENEDGTLAAFLPGRVADYFDLSNDGVRFAAAAGANRAPSVDAGGNAGDPVDHYEGREGQLVQFKATGVDADGDALTYAWDFDGDGTPEKEGAAVEYAYDDNGTFKATVTVDDQKGGKASADVSVLVSNVAPTAALSAPEGVDEGSPIALSVGSLVDPSASDVAAGFEFAFDCGEGYGAFGREAVASCATVDNGTRTIGVKVRDKNHDESVYTKAVTVRNVAPAVEVLQNVSAKSGQVVSLSGRFSDAGVNDRIWKWSWSAPSNASSATQGVASSSQAPWHGESSDQGPVAGQYRACAAGPQQVTLEVTDKDGGRGTATVTVTVEAAPAQMRVKPNWVALRTTDRDEDSDSDDDDRWGDQYGRLVTVYLYSHAGFDATTIDPSSVRLTNGSGKGTTVALKRGKKRGNEWEMKVGHLNGDRLRDVKLRFSRSALMANGDLNASTTSLTLTGRAGTCVGVTATAPVYVIR